MWNRHNKKHLFAKLETRSIAPDHINWHKDLGTASLVFYLDSYSDGLDMESEVRLVQGLHVVDSDYKPMRPHGDWRCEIMVSINRMFYKRLPGIPMIARDDPETLALAEERVFLMGLTFHPAPQSREAALVHRVIRLANNGQVAKARDLALWSMTHMALGEHLGQMLDATRKIVQIK